MPVQIHVSGEVIKNNRETGANNPPIVIHRDGASTSVHSVSILDANRNPVAKVVYRPDAPVNGAVVFIEADSFSVDL